MAPSHRRFGKPELCHFFQYRQRTALLSRKDPPALVEGTKLHVRGSLAAWRKRENLSPSHNSPYESVPRQAIYFCCKARVISHCERQDIKLVGLTTWDSSCFFTFKKTKGRSGSGASAGRGTPMCKQPALRGRSQPRAAPGLSVTPNSPRAIVQAITTGRLIWRRDATGFIHRFSRALKQGSLPGHTFLLKLHWPFLHCQIIVGESSCADFPRPCAGIRGDTDTLLFWGYSRAKLIERSPAPSSSSAA